MLSFLLAAMAAANSFTISDTTDNITGEREVYALQLANERTHLGFIYLRCEAGSPKVMLELYEVPKTEWIVVTADMHDGNSDLPLNFRRSDDLHNNMIYQGDSGELVGQLANSGLVAMTAHYERGDYTYTFSMDGLDSAWQRVTKYCLKSSD